MASIMNARLDMAPNRTTQTVDVAVTCEVHFTEKEVAQMGRKPGLMHFSLYCWLYGHDAAHPKLKGLQDELYAFPSRVLPSDGPAPVEKVAFEATLSQSLLNEDVVGKDEIYGRLVLRGWIGFKGLQESAETDVVSYAFA